MIAGNGERVMGEIIYSPCQANDGGTVVLKMFPVIFLSLSDAIKIDSQTVKAQRIKTVAA